jgi:hypothetical protein
MIFALQKKGKLFLVWMNCSALWFASSTECSDFLLNDVVLLDLAAIPILSLKSPMPRPRISDLKISDSDLRVLQLQ